MKMIQTIDKRSLCKEENGREDHLLVECAPWPRDFGSTSYPPPKGCGLIRRGLEELYLKIWWMVLNRWRPIGYKGSSPWQSCGCFRMKGTRESSKPKPRRCIILSRMFKKLILRCLRGNALFRVLNLHKFTVELVDWASFVLASF